MAKLLAMENRSVARVIYKGWKRIERMFVRIAGERKQRFHFTGGVSPGVQLASPPAAPSLRGVSHLHAVQKWELCDVAEQTVLAVDPVDDAGQFSDQYGGGLAIFIFAAQSRGHGLQLRRNKLFALEALENLRKKK